MRSLSDWLCLLESRHPVEIDLGLERVAEVYHNLGVVRPAPAVITVGGTNGKGSCVALLETLFSAAGLRVGSYTSPHILEFNERFRIEQHNARDTQLCKAFERVEIARGDVSLSYFEFTTLAGFWLFHHAQVDVAILEVGLGGRLDAVNLVDSDIAIITSIDLDHESYLGCTRESVAYEKAAIARPNCPLVCGETDPPKNLLDEFEKHQCQPLWFGRDFFLRLKQDFLQGQFKVAKQRKMLSNLPLSGLPLPSVACAIQVFYCLQERLPTPLTDHQLARVVSETRLMGRFQRLNFRGRNIILDVAHNPAAAELLAERLKREEGADSVAVVAMMKDKAIEQVIEPLKSVISEWFVGDLSDLPRAAKAEHLQQLLYNAGATAKCVSSVGTALKEAINNSDKNATIVVFGSFFTVAAAFEWLKNRGFEL
jgi:dihydrofolate synthase/folylpolyglutamate synthase